MPLEGLIDFEQERRRLQREQEKLQAEAAKLEAQLGNPNFVSRAPVERVNEVRARIADDCATVLSTSANSREPTMNWIDEGALYSQIGLFLREDLGRGDITTQSIIVRNTRARARFVAGENMIVAGLEAAEEVFLTLDSQQQLEAFVSDGEPVEAGKVIARMVGFADVLISAERVALNLLQRLSGIATLTNQYVKAVDGTGAQIADTRATTPGLRLLERYAVELGGGYNSRFGLDDGVVVTSNHISIVGGAASAVKTAKEKLGYLHKVAVEVSNENEVREAIAAGAMWL